MVSSNQNLDDSSGPKGENFAEEERRRKYIIGGVAAVGTLVAIFVLLWAFGATGI